MRIRETKLKGAYLIEPELFADERGFLHDHVLPEAIHGGRHRRKLRPVQCLFQQAAGHAAGNALSGRADGAAKARPLHARRDL